MHPMTRDAQDDPKAAHSPHRPCDDQRTALGELDDPACEKGGVIWEDHDYHAHTNEHDKAIWHSLRSA